MIGAAVTIVVSACTGVVVAFAIRFAYSWLHFPSGDASEKRRTYRVLVHWDEDAKVWWAESEEVPGLATEAFTFKQLDKNIRAIAPDLLELNKGSR